MNGEQPRPPERGPSTITDAELSAHTVAAFCKDCGTGRVGRSLRVIRWAERHGGHTGHVVPVRPWDAS